MVTDHIDTFTETGIRLRSGGQLEADVIVTATGLNMLLFGGLRLAVDGEDVDLPSTMAYKGIMLSGVPNFAFAMGYTNASWTLKVDLTYEYVWRLIRHMDPRGSGSCVPRRNDASVTEQPFLDFAAGYVLRSIDDLPKQGSKAPWRLRMNYVLDLLTLRFGRLKDGMLEFSWRARGSPPPHQRRVSTRTVVPCSFERICTRSSAGSPTRGRDRPRPGPRAPRGRPSGRRSAPRR